jgi:hypothetical protein
MHKSQPYGPILSQTNSDWEKKWMLIFLKHLCEHLVLMYVNKEVMYAQVNVVVGGRFNVVSVLTYSVLQDNYTALHIAVESAKPAVVETLLGYGADVHVTGEFYVLQRICLRSPYVVAEIFKG